MAIDFEFLKAERSRISSSNDWKARYVLMPEGEGSVTVRILPPGEGRPLYVVSRIHKIGNRNYHSPMTLHKGKWQGYCPMYNEYRKIWQDIEKLERQGKMDAARELRSLAGKIRPMERYYFNTIVRKEMSENGETLTDVGPKILSVGKELFEKILNAMLGSEQFGDEALGDITDLYGTEGRDFRIRKKLKKSSNGAAYPDYGESNFLAPSPAGTDEQIKKWMNSLMDLEAERKVRPIDELKEQVEIFMGRKEDTSLSVPTPTVEVQKPVVQQVVSSPVDTTDGEELADDDFLRSLRNPN